MGDETQGERRLSQDTVLQALGRSSKGYFSTPADGNCAPLAIDQTILSQSTYRHAHSSLRSKLVLAKAQRQLPHSRRNIEMAFHNNNDLTRLLSDDFCVASLGRTPNGLCGNTGLPNDGTNWKIVASQYGKCFDPDGMGIRGGMWYDEPAIRATAVTLQRSIVVVPPTAPVYFYPKQLGTYRLQGTQQSFDASTEASIVCLDRNGPFIPEEAFSTDTIVICHNGSNHFWCTELSKNRPSKEQCPLPVYDLVL